MNFTSPSQTGTCLSRSCSWPTALLRSPLQRSKARRGAAHAALPQTCGMQVALQLATCSLHVSQAADLAATNQHVFEQIIMSQIARYLQQVTCQVHPEYPSITGAPLGIDSSLRPETLAFPLNQPNLLQTARSEEFHNLAGELFRVLVCARRPQPDGHSPTAAARRPHSRPAVCRGSYKS